MKNTNYGWLKVFSFIFPIIGIVFYFVEVDKNPKKAKACLTGIIISIILTIAIGLISLVVFISLRNNSQNNYGDNIIEEIDETYIEDEPLQ